jgi:hypothetical protein
MLHRNVGQILWNDQSSVENAHDWNLDVGRLYMAGSLQTVARDVWKYRSDLVGSV